MLCLKLIIITIPVLSALEMRTAATHIPCYNITSIFRIKQVKEQIIDFKENHTLLETHPVFIRTTSMLFLNP